MEVPEQYHQIRNLLPYLYTIVSHTRPASVPVIVLVQVYSHVLCLKLVSI